MLLIWTCICAVQLVLSELEQPYRDHQAAHSSEGLVQVPQAAWQGLQCANCLRHMLHPAKLLPKKAQVCVSSDINKSHQ